MTPVTRSASARRALRAAFIVVASLSLIEPAQALTRVVAKEDAAPTPGGEYKVVRRPAVADSGAEPVAVRTKVRTGSGVTRGVYTEGSASGTEIALDQTPIAGLGGALLRMKGSTREAVALNASGIVVYGSSATGNIDGIFQNGSSQLVALSGDPLPGAVADEELEDFGKPRITDSGTVCFKSTVDNPELSGGGVPVDEVLLCCVGGDTDCSAGTGTATIMAAIDDPVPGGPGTLRVCEFAERIGASDYGITFVAGTSTNCLTYPVGALDGVFRVSFATPGTVDTIALEGEPSALPTNYATFESVPQLNSAGDVAFVSEMSDGQTDAVFLCDGACPTTAANVIVESHDDANQGMGPVIISLTRFAAPDVSDAGDVVFQARIEDPTATPKRALGIYRWNFATNTFTLIAQKGAATGDGGELRRIFFPDISPGGLIAFRAKAKYSKNLTVVFTEP